MAENPNGWNVRWLRCLPCGCVAGVTTLDALTPERQGICVVADLRAGYTLRLVAWDDEAAQNYHCPRYPHEPWQMDYERRLEAFARSGPPRPP